MSISKILHFLQRNIFKGNIGNFLTLNLESQMKKLDELGSPITLIERSFFQYKCQIENISLTLKIIQNTFAVPLFLFYLIRPYSLKKSTHFIESNNAVFLKNKMTTNTIPTSLFQEFENIVESPLKGEMFLSNKDKRILFQQLKKYWKHPYFMLKCIIKVSYYSYVINKYNPVAIITHNEYSFTSSMLTSYCRIRGVEHINVMHGEKLLNIRDSFVEYDRFFVWDEHYVSLFKELKADVNQFVIEEPKSLYLNVIHKKEYDYYLTYYLGGENKERLMKLKETLLKLCVPKDRICIRLHPRYSNEQEIKEIFKGFYIEKPREVSLESSLNKTEHVVSIYSTVLYQAYLSGKKIIIDDSSDFSLYNKLEKLHYIMIHKPHSKLSSYLE